MSPQNKSLINIINSLDNVFLNQTNLRCISTFVQLAQMKIELDINNIIRPIIYSTKNSIDHFIVK